MKHFRIQLLLAAIVAGVISTVAIAKSEIPKVLELALIGENELPNSHYNIQQLNERAEKISGMNATSGSHRCNGVYFVIKDEVFPTRLKVTSDDGIIYNLIAFKNTRTTPVKFFYDNKTDPKTHWMSMGIYKLDDHCFLIDPWLGESLYQAENIEVLPPEIQAQQELGKKVLEE